MAVTITAAREWPWSRAALDRLQWQIEDFIHLSGRLAPEDPSVVVLGIDDASLNLESAFPEDIADSEALQLIENGWIWPRSVYSLLIERLLQAGARCVVLDLMFATPTPDHPEYDTALRATVEWNPEGVLLGADLVEESLDFETATIVMPTEAVLPDASVGHPQVGFLTYWPDSDAVLRNVRTHYQLTPESTERIDALPLAALKLIGEEAPADDLPENLAIRFGHPLSYQPLSLHDVFVEPLWESNFGGGGFFNNKVVFMGPTARHFQDTLATPVGELNGVQVHAQVFAALRAKQFVQRLSENAILGGIFGAAILAFMLLLMLRRPLLTLVILALGTLAGLTIQRWAFNDIDLVVPMLCPLLSWNLTGIFALGFEFVVERRQKERLRSYITRYFSPDMAEEIIQKPESYLRSIGGAQKEVTVLFSDLRGFTSLSEKKAADELVAQLNQYLEKMVEQIFNCRGSIDKFIGDAIMSVWGRLRDVCTEDDLKVDARNAVQTALSMQTALKDLNEGWVASGEEALDIGVGIHQGSAVAGNIGSSSRMEFTVIGDAVNLTARLESATKQYGLQILVSDAVRERVEEEFLFRRVDLVNVKGKLVPVAVHTVLGPADMTSPGGLASYEKGIDLFRSGQFDGALAAFEEAAAARLNDKLTQVYVDRCQTLIAEPPEDWKGVWVLTQK